MKTYLFLQWSISVCCPMIFMARALMTSRVLSFCECVKMFRVVYHISQPTDRVSHKRRHFIHIQRRAQLSAPDNDNNNSSIVGYQIYFKWFYVILSGASQHSHLLFVIQMLLFRARLIRTFGLHQSSHVWAWFEIDMWEFTGFFSCDVERWTRMLRGKM